MRWVTSGVPRPSRRRFATSVSVPTTWAATSATVHPSHRVTFCHSSSLSERISSANASCSATKPGRTTSRGKGIGEGVAEAEVMGVPLFWDGRGTVAWPVIYMRAARIFMHAARMYNVIVVTGSERAGHGEAQASGPVGGHARGVVELGALPVRTEGLRGDGEGRDRGRRRRHAGRVAAPLRGQGVAVPRRVRGGGAGDRDRRGRGGDEGGRRSHRPAAGGVPCVPGRGARPEHPAHLRGGRSGGAVRRGAPGRHRPVRARPGARSVAQRDGRGPDRRGAGGAV